MSKKHQKKQAKEPDSETTENEFSEYVSDNNQDVKFRGKREEIKNIQQARLQEKENSKNMRNIPFGVSVKYENFIVRAIYTILMLLFFVAIVLLGHSYCSIFVIFLNLVAFQEICALKRNAAKDQLIPYFQFVNWYFYIIGTFFFYGKLFLAKFPELVDSHPQIQFVFKYHNLICFLGWCSGFLLFVFSLKKGFYRYQFRQFAWSHISVLLISATSGTIIFNIYEGLVWFIFPALLVIANDTFAYIFGFAFGKTKLIDLSPKKTWEGFIGGFISTLFWAVLLSAFFAYFPYLYCPQDNLTLKPLQTLTCQINPIFIKHNYNVPSQIANIIGIQTIGLTNFQFHALVFSMFASFIAPFGGFFASGFKRANKIKDFGDSIPGHGGVMDRMDCQFMMGLFSYLYLNQIILLPYTIPTIMNLIKNLPDNDKLKLFDELKNNLSYRKLLNGTISQ